jgi:hypothetical protein
MKSLFITVVCLLLTSTGKSQNVKFGHSSPLILKEGKTDETFSIPVSLEDPPNSLAVQIDVDDANSSATKDKDYTISTRNITLDNANKYSGVIQGTVKADAFIESKEEIHLKVNGLK